MAAPVTRRIKRAIAEGLEPHLFASGYKKTAWNWHAVAGGVIRIVGVQLSSGTQGECGSFTINVGAYHVAIEARITPKGQRVYDVPWSNEPWPDQGTLSNRVGMLLPDPVDIWWNVDPETNIEKVATDLSTIWTTILQPWMELASSPRGALARRLEMRNPLAAAAFHLELGERAEARESVLRAIDSASDWWKANFRSWAVLEGLMES